MNKYSASCDDVYNEIHNKMNAPKVYKLASVQDRIEHIGCGVVRFTDENNKVGLWQIQQDPNGEEYIAAMYDDIDGEVIKQAWTVETDKLKKAATIFYKSTPVKNIVFAEVGVNESDVSDFVRYLPNKLASDESVVEKMLNEVDATYKQALVNKFPELSK